MAKEITNIVKVFLELCVSKTAKEITNIRVCVSKMAKEITNIVKVFLELVYQRWLRRSPIL